MMIYPIILCGGRIFYQKIASVVANIELKNPDTHQN